MSNYIQSLVKGNQTLTEKVEVLQIRIKELEKENYELRKNNIELDRKVSHYEDKASRNNTNINSIINKIMQDDSVYSNIINIMEGKINE